MPASTGSVTSQSLVQSLVPTNADFGGFIGKEGVFFSMKCYRDHIDMYLSELGYSELVQRHLKKMAFFRVDPLPPEPTAKFTERHLRRRGRYIRLSTNRWPPGPLVHNFRSGLPHRGRHHFQQSTGTLGCDKKQTRRKTGVRW